MGQPLQTVYATPSMLTDAKAASRALANALHLTGKRSRRALRAALSDKSSQWAFVARKVDPQLAKAALALHLPGVGSYSEEARAYPMGGSAMPAAGAGRHREHRARRPRAAVTTRRSAAGQACSAWCATLPGRRSRR